MGENGIITQVQNAKIAQELAQTKEQLEYMFAEYNIDDGGEGIVSYLRDKETCCELDKIEWHEFDVLNGLYERGEL